jgi:hypothetical protein
MRSLKLISALTLFCASATAIQLSAAQNLLLNPKFDFHAFNNHRGGNRVSYMSHNAAFWNTDNWRDITVERESHVPEKMRPDFTVDNMVKIMPGKKIRQFSTLPEMDLGHGDRISLSVYGYQSAPKALKASIKLMKLDSEDGEWKPSDFGMKDKRSFPKHSRGELVVAKTYSATSDKTGLIEIKIDDAEVLGKVTRDKNSHTSDMNTIGIEVEFENESKDGTVWICSPCLVKGQEAVNTTQTARKMIPYYRYIPRTIQKLWKGEPIHIIVMGSSIDRGSANPPMYPYNEDPKSKDFKKPLTDAYYGKFDTKSVGRPELNDYYGESRHYFSYGGRLRLELMKKFDMPVNKILLNFMACDGSCVGEAHSGLADYCSLSIPPQENANGHKSGKTWQELYPDIFKRPEGPRPDLIIFGSGANEKTDTPDEVAVFEGTIRWIQRHYPNTEFLFCQFQNYGGYTPSPGDMQALSLRYQIPFLDYGKAGDDIVRWCNRYALVPKDGHPQAAAHYLWFKQLEKAFECWDPTMPGQAQLQLPERTHKNTYGWEGEMITFDEKSPRLKGNKFVFEDTAINCWGSVADKEKPIPYVDGQKLSARRSSPRRDVRNSLFRHGNTTLGDRHILEITGKDAKLTYVDAKVCPNRQFLGMDNPRWNDKMKVENFDSEWGAPYGSRIVELQPGKTLEIDAVCTDISVAYVDQKNGGELKVFVDGKEKLNQPTNIPFVDQEKKSYFMENRKGILNLGFGLHKIKIEAVKAPVKILGIFTYDSRSNRKFERKLTGIAAPGETIEFTLPFKNTPVVICEQGLKPENVTATKVKFTGEKQGMYQIIGE